MKYQAIAQSQLGHTIEKTFYLADFCTTLNLYLEAMEWLKIHLRANDWRIGQLHDGKEYVMTIRN
jgi:hypothetical protein